MNALLTVLIIIFVVGLVAVPRILHSAHWKGKAGEKSVANVLATLPIDYFTLNDVVLETENGTTQIDHVVVSKFGIFAIETKNYRGDIYGDDYREKWTQNIVTNVTYRRKWWKTYTYVTKNQFYNPVKQSYGHAKRIQELLGDMAYIPVIPIVVFVGNSNLSGISTSHEVVRLANLRNAILKYQKIYNVDTLAVRNRILNANKRDVVSQRQHVQNLHNAEYKRNADLRSGICPRCGGNLVFHHGKFGDFYGCSNYPKCRFTTK